LAAKTGLDEKKLNDFGANMEGVENMLRAFEETRSIERVIFASSLLVCGMGYIPKHDTDYQPTTLCNIVLPAFYNHRFVHTVSPFLK
jgi:nucleoside-diphosphate-sugar epimerase